MTGRITEGKPEREGSKDRHLDRKKDGRRRVMRIAGRINRGQTGLKTRGKQED
jgi:hypothetical protein